MPITYEPTDRLVRYYGSKIRKLSPKPEIGWFLGGLVAGYFVLPFVMALAGYKVEKIVARK